MRLKKTPGAETTLVNVDAVEITFSVFGQSIKAPPIKFPLTIPGIA